MNFNDMIILLTIRIKIIKISLSPKNLIEFAKIPEQSSQEINELSEEKKQYEKN